ncbi:MAG: hypothetical protein QXT54_00835 [Thermoplasmatales archaeon]
MGKFLRGKEESIALHRKLIAFFNYSPYLDFLAGLELNSLIRADLWSTLPRIRSASVIGPANPPKEVDGFVIVADSALNSYSGRYDMIVTDLDGPANLILRGNTLKVVHAHGDNIERIVNLVPRIEGSVLGTTQSIPVGSVRNIGGFTDGDRSVIMAVLMGAERVKIYGFDFENPVDEPKDKKIMKMKVAKDILNNIRDVEISFEK